MFNLLLKIPTFIKTIFFFDPLEQFDVLVFQIPYFFEFNNLIIFTFFVLVLLGIINADTHAFNLEISPKSEIEQNHHYHRRLNSV